MSRIFNALFSQSPSASETHAAWVSSLSEMSTSTNVVFCFNAAASAATCSSFNLHSLSCSFVSDLFMANASKNLDVAVSNTLNDNCNVVPKLFFITSAKWSSPVPEMPTSVNWSSLTPDSAFSLNPWANFSTPSSPIWLRDSVTIDNTLFVLRSSATAETPSSPSDLNSKSQCCSPD